MIVKLIKTTFVFISKLDEANTLGINKNIAKGFSIPPDKYISAVNWIISINKKFNADLFVKYVFL